MFAVEFFTLEGNHQFLGHSVKSKRSVNEGKVHKSAPNSMYEYYVYRSPMIPAFVRPAVWHFK